MASLKAQEQIIVPDCTEGTDTWTLNPGQVLKNKKGCGMTFKPVPNPDGTASVGSIKHWGSPTPTQWDVNTPNCTGGACGKGVEEIRADKAQAFTLILGICPPGKADPQAKTFACKF